MLLNFKVLHLSENEGWHETNIMIRELKKFGKHWFSFGLWYFKRISITLKYFNIWPFLLQFQMLSFYGRFEKGINEIYTKRLNLFI